MADVGLPGAVPNAGPVSGTGQKPYANPQNRKKKKDGEPSGKAKDGVREPSGCNEEGGQETPAGGKGALVDIVA